MFFLHPFNLILFVSLKYISCRQHIVGSCFLICTDNLCPSLVYLYQLHFKVIIDIVGSLCYCFLVFALFFVPIFVLYYLMLFYYFFSFIFISWRLITLQYWGGFCHTLTWISHGFTCISHPDPLSHLPLYPIPLGLPSAPGPSTCLMHPTWAGDLFHHR